MFKNVTVAGGGVLGSQIAFQTAYCGFHVKIWLRTEASIERCKPKLDRLRVIYLSILDEMKSGSPAAYARGLSKKISPFRRGNRGMQKESGRGLQEYYLNYFL